MAHRMQLLLAATSTLALLTTGVSGNDFSTQGYASGDFSSARSIGELEFVVPVLQNEQTLLFLNARGLINSAGEEQASIGAGIRHLMDDKFIVGAYGIYDRFSSDNGNRFNQAVFGGEIMAERWDVRFNYYRAFNQTRLLSSDTEVSSVSSAITGNDLFLSGNFLFANQTITDTARTTRIFERANNGWEAEAGYELFKGLRAFGGYYDFSALNADISGPKGRVEWNVADSFSKDWGFDVTFTGAFTDDDVRGSEFSGGVRLTVPFGKAREHKASARVRDRMTEWIRRDFDVVTNVAASTTIARSERVVETQVSDQVYRFFDNSAPEGGDGTFENPYNDFYDENRVPHSTGEGDILFVYAGEGRYETIVQLLPGQSLIGEASGLRALGADLIAPGERPQLFIEDTEGPTRPEGVILATGNNFISGLNLRGLGAPAITADLESGEFLNIDDVIVSTEGVFFDETDPSNQNGTGILVAAARGAEAANEPIVINITNSRYVGSGSGVGISTFYETPNVEVNLVNNFILGSLGSSAVSVAARSNITVNLVNNQFTYHTGTAVDIAVVQAADLFFNASGNTVVGSGTAFNFSFFPLTVQPDGEGARVIDLGGGTLNSEGTNRIFGNTLDFASDHAVNVSARNNFWQGTPDDQLFDLFPGSTIETDGFLALDPDPSGFGACPAGEQLAPESTSDTIICQAAP